MSTALLGAAVVGPPAQAATPALAGAYLPVASKTVLKTHSVRAKHAITVAVGGHAGVPKSAEAVALRLSVATPSRSGVLTAYSGRRPNVTTLRFTQGQPTMALAIVKLPKSGKIKIFNSASASVRVSATVSGYYRAGSTKVAGSFVPVTPKRVLNKTYRASAQPVIAVGGHARVPRSAGAVVGVLSAVGPAKAGSAVLWQNGAAKPGTANLRFSKHTSTATLAVVPLSASGAMKLYNHAKAKIHYTFDVVGYYVAGAPAKAGATGVIAPRNNAKTLKAKKSFALKVSGKGGVPATNVRSVTAILTVSAAKADGSAFAYQAGKSAARSTVLQFERGTTTSGLVTVPVASNGKIRLANKSHGKAKFTLSVVGYTLKSSLPAAKTYVSHYVTDLNLLPGQGARDRVLAPKLVVLHLGAQLNDRTGVQLSFGGSPTYAEVVNALQGYLANFGPHSGVTIAVATNNDAHDWTNYPAASRGRDWADQVVDRLGGYGLSVVGANDIEWGFYSTAQQALAWESAYLTYATTERLIFTGDANGCPTTFGSNASCNWTLAQEYQLAGGKDPRIQALPQIYNGAQAAQWANIDRVGGRKIHFIGALTENSAFPTKSWDASHAYPAFWNALAAIGVVPPAVVTDLDVQG